ncbi:DUF6115 domain-containing protein [Alteribacillus sp. JSM 102045]|uniref:DUF6115 domain-containing protein n=1 Tax=Alteribacillus sp. JSM 102045 TaxID=1562101 RepID=UPI0035C0BE27
MTIFLLIISMAFHLLTFFLLILFFHQQQRLKEERRDLYGMREDMEELLESYTKDIKKENEELKSLLDKSSSFGVDSDRNPFAEQTNLTSQADLQAEDNGQKPSKKEYISSSPPRPEEYVPPVPEKGKEKIEQSTQAQVLSLASQGYRRDEIAKKLNMGKGEVDLLLKFYNK